MIIVKSPYRIALGGGGACDFEEYFTEFGPVVSIGFTFSKYCYLTLMHLPNINGINFQIAYSSFERENEIKDIKNPGVRGTLEYLKTFLNVDFSKLGINIINQINPKTGIGSSSSMICCLIKGLYKYLDMDINNKNLSRLAIEIERNHLMEYGGWNDQIYTSFGDFISITYNKNTTYVVKPLAISDDFKNFFLSSCVLYYTSENNTRNSFKISKSYKNNKSINYKHEISRLSQEIKIELENENLEQVGKLIHESWIQKKKVSNLITNHEIDGIYDKIKKSGALGGRLMGSGGSGFIFTVYPDIKSKISGVNNLNIPYLDVELDKNGTQILFNEKN